MINLEKTTELSERPGKEKWHQILINTFPDHYDNAEGIKQ